MIDNANLGEFEGSCQARMAWIHKAFFVSIYGMVLFIVVAKNGLSVMVFCHNLLFGIFSNTAKLVFVDLKRLASRLSCVFV
jgi:hypothetical protein